ncbi:MAG TPA: GGDEF domain-containing protein [Candidatus Tumulicola sp.]|nr:GGDEF domain-containing protein [Candidatus Tumulicola sp.]
MAVAVIVLLSLRSRALGLRAERAERRFAELENIAPALTNAAMESTAATCSRILDRVAVLVPAQTLLCFYVDGGHLMLGAKRGPAYIEFLREGEPYDGDTIVDWVKREARTAITGPGPYATVGPIDAIDLGASPTGAKLEIGPIAGSRDTLWAAAVPMLRPQAQGRRAEVVGVLYADRPRKSPFTTDDMLTLSTIAQLAGDALQRARFTDQVRRTSDIDGLTGLLTPVSFRRRLRDEVETRRRRSGRSSVALYFIDTDLFKQWNDRFGHAAGDALLKRLAATFKELAARTEGFAGRNGGDEFCIAVLDGRKEDAIRLGQDLCRRIASADFTSRDGSPHVTISIGLAQYPEDVDPDERQPADRLLETADAQMYEAKHAGRNTLSFVRARPIAARE